MPDPRAPRLAVLIDADNVPAGYAEAIFEEIAALGEASVRRIYGDWSAQRLNAWAKKVAFHQILTFRRKSKRDTALSEESLELLAHELTRNEKQLDIRAAALRKCVRQLSRPHRQIFLMRYSRDMGIDEIASAVDRTEGAVYRLLSRLRASLQECVNKNTPATS